MKLNPLIQTKQTTRLFIGKYKYKIVLLSKVASFFRSKDIDTIKKNIINCRISPSPWQRNVAEVDLTFAEKIAGFISTTDNFIIRIESPYLNFYTNTASDIEKLAKVDPEHVKYVCLPAPGSEAELDLKKVIVKKIDHQYRVTMGRSRQNHNSFVDWCENHPDKVKLPKRAKHDLRRDHSWGGYYFYVKDEKTLTMVKMFVGGEISTVEHCVKQ